MRKLNENFIIRKETFMKKIFIMTGICVLLVSVVIQGGSTR